MSMQVTDMNSMDKTDRKSNGSTGGGGFFWLNFVLKYIYKTQTENKFADKIGKSVSVSLEMSVVS